MTEKRLYRSRDDRVIAGVCSGLGKYLDVDPVIIRLIWAATIFLAGAGIFLYIVAWIIIPEEPLKNRTTQNPEKESSDVYDSEFDQQTETYNSEQKIKEQLERERRGKLAIGVGIVIVGIIFLFSQIFSFNISWRVIVGILLILAGGAVLLRFFREER
ncbi:MAG: phage shock protein [Thermotogaceae bacterium]|jgi:phage shock protein PspC (stress-responsive transcriptional regulator)|nr:phage shock protein [Thermotogaceae bacterium]